MKQMNFVPIIYFSLHEISSLTAGHGILPIFELANAGNLIQYVISNISSISLFIVLLLRFVRILRNESHFCLFFPPLIRRS